MVKNELSLKSQQSLKVATKIAEHSINRITRKVNKEILKVNSSLTFKSIENEKKMYEARLKALKENIYATYANCEDEANITLYKNEYDLHKLNWSFVKLDRNTIDKEKIRKSIATNRHSTAIYDINMEEAKNTSRWQIKEKNAYIKFMCEYDKQARDFVKDNTPYKKEYFDEFYNKVSAEYEKIKKDSINEINKLYPSIESCVSKAYEKTYAREAREEILSINKLINECYLKIISLNKENIYLDVDVQILNEQLREKLDVVEEKNEKLATIEENKKEIESLYNKVNEQKEKLTSLYQARIDARTSNVINEIKVDDQVVQELLDNIASSFNLPSNQSFNKVYRLVKYYILSKVPYFLDYINEKEKEHNRINEEYRKETIKSLDGDALKAYKNEAKYYLYLNNTSKSADSEPIKDSLVKSLKLFKEEVSLLRKNKKERIQVYKTQKANAKERIKTADAAKAADLKEVTKLYKKEINTGEFKRYRKVVANIVRNFIGFRKANKDRIIETCYPKPLVVENEYKNEKAIVNKERKYISRKLKRELNKDFVCSKYRANFTTKTRENALGYLFLAIWGVGFLVFTFGPILFTIAMLWSNISYGTTGYSKLIEISFSNGIKFPSFVGWENFNTLFLSNVDFTYTYLPRFFRSLLFYVPIVVFIGFVLAMLLNSKIKGRTLFRIIYFLPVVIVSGPVLSMLNDNNSSGQSSIRLSLDGSAVAKILASLSPKALTIANEVFNNFVIILWMTGVPIVLFISALQKINKQLYEAAEIDGANKWQTLWAVTFPLIKSIMLIVCLFTIMQVTTIDVSFVNPINSWLSSKLATSGVNLSFVALGAWAQTIVVLLFVLVAFLLFREKEFVSKDKNFEEIEELKRKKALRKAKINEFFHINDIRSFLMKVFTPLIRFMEENKEKRRIKQEERKG